MGFLELRQQVWSRYWASGAAHSCFTSYGERYGGAIAAFWQQVCEETPRGSRLLDLATGSGAIPRLWRDCRTGDQWDAVDLATTAPPWMVDAGDGLRFHAAVQAESLPFPAASFDLITSQYGLEYCDQMLAVPELLRVRAPLGGVALILHHAASRPVTLARTELSHLGWAFGAEGLVRACGDMLGHAAEASTPQGRMRLALDASAEAARVRFNAAQIALRERASHAEGADALGEIQDSVSDLLQLAMRQGVTTARAKFESWQRNLADHRWRLEELCNHALDQAAVEALVGQLQRAGLTVDLRLLHDGPHLMGWALRARAH